MLDSQQMKIDGAQLVPTLVRVSLLHCHAPGRRWASGASDEHTSGNELPQRLFIPHWL